ncbi:hypothetical protein DL768_003702 [Monosporascus sp. mg162]|nr:hypothetical protein DL768_003702 [Monosporascus sp. mg162]
MDAKLERISSCISTGFFHVEIDDISGAVVRLTRPDDSINWVGSAENTPWQPLGSRWGLGFADLGEDLLHRYFWTNPTISSERDDSLTAVYTADRLELNVTRTIHDDGRAFTERYTFRNRGDSLLDLRSRGEESLAVYTPFNDHYTNTTDALSNRAHAHIWANGGSTAWVKMEQMGGHGPNLGLVLTRGSLSGYSVESRDPVTLSNTRGVFLLHPTIPALGPGQFEILEWTLFWHEDWDDFFAQCARRSEQFIKFDIERYTLVESETMDIRLSGAVNSQSTIDGEQLDCNNSVCTYRVRAGKIGKKSLIVSTPSDRGIENSTIYINIVRDIQELIRNRVHFIANNQQVSAPDNPLDGAYVVYDNQAQAIASWDKSTDRNAGRERLGMGILMARWLKTHPKDRLIRKSLVDYYTYVCLQLQDENGYVYDGPPGTNRDRKRLYNWPWVTQLHIAVAALDLDLKGVVAEKTPIERFMLTLENFYNEGGMELYAIGLPILESLRYLEKSGDDESFQRVQSLFIRHGEEIIRRGLNYPAFEVNFEQSIVAPAAVMLLELYRFTGNETWLQVAEIQLETLLRFEGMQPDYRLHNIAIRHWDGYWFGKDRHWGDTFPHHWSTLDAIALHHYGKSTHDEASKNRADNIIRGNLALFDGDGRAGCAWIYPVTVNGRSAHYRDPYANDQDWVLNHFLYLKADDKYDQD